MAIRKIKTRDTIWAGSSFHRPISRRDKMPWEKDHSGVYGVYDEDGGKVLSGTLAPTTDRKHLVLMIRGDQTLDLDGRYIVIVELTDLAVPGYVEGLADIELTVKTRRAGTS